LQLDKSKIHTPIASLIVSVKLPKSKLNAFFGSIHGRPLFCRILNNASVLRNMENFRIRIMINMKNKYGKRKEIPAILVVLPHHP